MKRKKLKIEGEEKLKIELVFDLNEVKITLFEGGTPTKLTETIILNNVDKDINLELIANTIEKIYDNYVLWGSVEKSMVDIFESKEYIEFPKYNVVEVDENNTEEYSF